MTAGELSKLLGISRRSLFLYRKNYPDQAPETFDNFREWKRFVTLVKVYDSDRSQRKIGPLQNGWDQEYSPAAERKERIIKLQLANAIRDQEWKNLRRRSVRITELVETMNIITATVQAEFREVPRRAAKALSGKGAAEIQIYLETVMRNALERLSCPDLYVQPATQHENGELCISPISSIMTAGGGLTSFGQSLASQLCR